MQTQPLLETATLEAYLQRLVESRVLQRVSLVVTVPVITSTVDLEALQNSASKVLLPVEIEKQLAGDSVRERAIRLAAETIARVRSLRGTAAVNVSGNDAAAIAEAISLSEIRS